MPPTLQSRARAKAAFFRLVSGVTSGPLDEEENLETGSKRFAIVERENILFFVGLEERNFDYSEQSVFTHTPNREIVHRLSL